MTVTANLEREVKLEVGLRFALPDLDGVLPGVTAVALSDAKLRAAYIDTADLRLMRWGITLRHRLDVEVGGTGESGWTIKLPEDADGVALVRQELSWPGRLGPVPDEVRRMVRAHARSAPLEVVAKLTTQRHRVELRDAEGRRLAEIDDDVVSVLDGRRLAARFREVEIEVDASVEDTAALLEAVLERMTEAGALIGDDRPKVVRALGPRAQRPPDVVVPELDRDATISDVIRASIAAALTRMVRHDPGMRLDDDPEHVHQARVGTRRLRSDLRTFRSLVDPDWAGRVRAELGWAADALGGVRDADVLTDRLRSQIAGLPAGDARPAAGLLRRLAAQREVAMTAMLAVLDSDRYVALLDDLARAAANPPLARWITDPAAVASGRHLPLTLVTAGTGPDRVGPKAASPDARGAAPAGAARIAVLVPANGAATAGTIHSAVALTGDASGGSAAGPSGDTMGAPAAGPAGDTMGAPAAGPAGDTMGAPAAGPADETMGAPVAGPAGDAAAAAAGDSLAAGQGWPVTASVVAAPAEATPAGDTTTAVAAPADGPPTAGAVLATPAGAAPADGAPTAGAVPAAPAGGPMTAGDPPGPVDPDVTPTADRPPAPASSLPAPAGAGQPHPGPVATVDGSPSRPAAVITPDRAALAPGDQPAREVLPALVRMPWRHLQRAVVALGEDPPDEALHEVRIRAKRLRYAAEAAVGVIGRPAKVLATAVAEVQGVLGDMQDAVVAEEWLRRTSVTGGAAQALVAGELVALQRDQQAACRRAWTGPWKAASARRLREWLKD